MAAMAHDDDLNVGARRRLPDADYADPNAIFFVTVCARRGTAPFTDSRLAACVMRSLEWLRTNRGVRIYACCLMPDHLHLLLQLGDSSQSLGDVVRSMKLHTTRESWRLGYTGQLWQDRFYHHILRAAEGARSIAEYIWNNPVRKGLVEHGEDYPYSLLPDPMQPATGGRPTNAGPFQGHDLLPVIE